MQDMQYAQRLNHINLFLFASLLEKEADPGRDNLQCSHLPQDDCYAMWQNAHIT